MAQRTDIEERLAAIEAGLDASLAGIAEAATTAELGELRVRLLGRKAPLNAIAAQMGAADPADRPHLGKRISDLRARLQEALDARSRAVTAQESAARLEVERVDLTLPGRARRLGVSHLVSQVTREIEDLFVGMGYRVVEGPEVETDWYDFEALNLPKIHPARSMQDTIYVESPRAAADEVLLRTHTSPVQIRTMQQEKPPIYVISPGRTVRRDDVDATHFAVFHQFEGFAVDKGITFGDLAGTLEYMARALFGQEREIRLRPSYFPYTEPSAEIDCSCFICDGTGRGPEGEWKGCRTCKGSGWIELGGSGMIHPQVFLNVGYDPEEVTGFAFGMGIERIALLRHGIPDGRAFLENDLRFLEQFR